MEEQRTVTRNKGGRPKKAVKKDQILAVKCSLFERKAIEARAKSVNLTVSEYLREMALTGKVVACLISVRRILLSSGSGSIRSRWSGGGAASHCATR